MIESKRLIIRPYNIDDVKLAFDLFHDKDVMAFIPYGADKSIEDTQIRIDKYISHYHTFGFGKYVLIEKSNNELIGDCGISTIENTGINELGYRIKKSFWNQGYATEAAKAVINYAFTTLKFKTLHAIVEKGNKKSIHILVDKLGFKHENAIYCYGIDFDLYRFGQKL